jgi:hypothetical protein
VSARPAAVPAASGRNRSASPGAGSGRPAAGSPMLAARRRGESACARARRRPERGASRRREAGCAGPSPRAAPSCRSQGPRTRAPAARPSPSQEKRGDGAGTHAAAVREECPAASRLARTASAGPLAGSPRSAPARAPAGPVCRALAASVPRATGCSGTPRIGGHGPFPHGPLPESGHAPGIRERPNQEYLSPPAWRRLMRGA